MDDSSPTPKFVDAAVFLCAAASIAYALYRWPMLGENWIADIGVIGSLVFFLFASTLVFGKPNFAYPLGLIAGLIAVPWFVRTVLQRFDGLWTVLNGFADDEMPYGKGTGAILAAVIFSVALIVVATVLSSLRLLPGKSRLRLSTWPACVAALLMIAIWFLHSVTPYRIPMIVDGVAPAFRILHVEKHGFQFHETAVAGFRDRKLWITRNDRRLFQYRFYEQGVLGSMPEAVYAQTRALLESAELRKMHTRPPVNLRSWTAEGWYAVLPSSEFLAFTSEYGTMAPPDVIALFHELEKLPGFEQRRFPVQDVCLGFCYDPIAGLGFVFVNQRPR